MHSDKDFGVMTEPFSVRQEAVLFADMLSDVSMLLLLLLSLAVFLLDPTKLGGNCLAREVDRLFVNFGLA